MRALQGPGPAGDLLPIMLILVGSTARASRQVEGGSFGNEEHPRRHHHHRHDVHLAGFFPTTEGHHQSRIGQGVMPAVRLALRDVNKSPHILPNIHLRMHWNNTAVSVVRVIPIIRRVVVVVHVVLITPGKLLVGVTGKKNKQCRISIECRVL